MHGNCWLELMETNQKTEKQLVEDFWCTSNSASTYKTATSFRYAHASNYQNCITVFPFSVLSTVTYFTNNCIPGSSSCDWKDWFEFKICVEQLIKRWQK